MDGKTVWDHVLDEPVASPPGERPMKSHMDARFDGSFAQFIEWMNEVFKNPDSLRVRVIVGTVPLREEIVPSERVKTYSKEVRELNRVAGGRISLVEAEAVMVKIWKAMPHMKIEAIKLVREHVSGIGLKEAKDFVEALPEKPSNPDPEDEIPF